MKQLGDVTDRYSKTSQGHGMKVRKAGGAHAELTSLPHHNKAGMRRDPGVCPSTHTRNLTENYLL